MLRHWLTRDSRGLSSTSDIKGCFEKGPDQFFPGRFSPRIQQGPSLIWLQVRWSKMLRSRIPGRSRDWVFDPWHSMALFPAQAAKRCCMSSTPASLHLSSAISSYLLDRVRRIREFPKIRDTLFWGPYNQAPPIWGTVLGSPMFGNSHTAPGAPEVSTRLPSSHRRTTRSTWRRRPVPDEEFE